MGARGLARQGRPGAQREQDEEAAHASHDERGAGIRLHRDGQPVTRLSAPVSRKSTRATRRGRHRAHRSARDRGLPPSPAPLAPRAPPLRPHSGGSPVRPYDLPGCWYHPLPAPAVGQAHPGAHEQGGHPGQGQPLLDHGRQPHAVPGRAEPAEPGLPGHRGASRRRKASTPSAITAPATGTLAGVTSRARDAAVVVRGNGHSPLPAPVPGSGRVRTSPWKNGAAPSPPPP